MASLGTRLVTSWLVLSVVVSVSMFAQGMPRAEPEDVGLSSVRLQRLSDVFQGYVNDGRLAGAVALVARHGKVAYLEAFGYRELDSRAPMPEEAIFRIASQSKAIVSVGVMMLQEEGRLLITDPVGKYRPEFQHTTVAVSREGGGYDIVDANRPIRIRDLLTHTAGIGYGEGVARDRWAAAGIQGWYFAHRDEPVGATVARIAALPFDAQPGERYVYGYSTDDVDIVDIDYFVTCWFKNCVFVENNKKTPKIGVLQNKKTVEKYVYFFLISRSFVNIKLIFYFS